MKKITAIMWHTYANIMRQAKENVKDDLEVKVYSVRFLDEGKEELDDALKDIESSDLVFLYRSNADAVWTDIEAALKNKNKIVICLAQDPILWGLSTINLEMVAKCRPYILYGRVDNFTELLKYIGSEVSNLDLKYKEPLDLPWEGIYHPRAPKHFSSIEDYCRWYKLKDAPTVGILMSRGNWVNKNIEPENKIINLLENKGYNVIPVFAYSLKDEELGTRSAAEVVEDYFFDYKGSPRIDGLVKLTCFFLNSRARSNDFIDKNIAANGVNLLERLNVPVFQPITSFYSTVEEWEEDPQGLNKDISWTVAMPEFEGVIEPVMISGAKREEYLETRMAIDERCSRLVDKIHKWIKLAKRPLKDRKVAFILHNNPCASVEATVGGGANLDTLESVARIMKSMKEVGYSVNPPESGKELISNIMDRKAISEFRWTTADEIVKKGGVLKALSVDDYKKWFYTWSPKVQEEIIKAWGNPPGEEMDGVPASMVYEGEILITGVSYENAVVCVQPKRGCAGTRCDGKVCKILHDPDIPPTHQYLATYNYLEKEFAADVLVHVGTHGNLEFLPGKGVGLSKNCYPDIAIADIPHLYIYNADNPPEGTIAKRRSYAVLVDHMQTLFVEGGLYDELAELERYLEDYEKAKVADPNRAHTLKHMIKEEIEKTNLDKQIALDGSLSFEEIVEKAHGILSLVKNTGIQDGQHIFGEIPEGEKKIQFINSILKFDSTEKISLRGQVAKSMGLEIKDLIANGEKFSSKFGKSYGAILEYISNVCVILIRELLEKEEITEVFFKELLGEKLANIKTLKEINDLFPRIQDLNKRIEESKEIEALLRGFNGEYISAGPSGLVTRGRDDVLPTGRNFYSIDPYRVPTKASWRVGQMLANEVLKKHMEEESRYPENVAIQWMCNDVMWSDGEGLAQMLYLIGAIPKWAGNGRVCGFEVISLEELGRPRIDLTVRVSGILRDNFPNSMDLLDEAVQKIASLDEPIEMNFVRKHTLEKLDGDKSEEAFRDATFRIFASKPGTYGSGVNLAVYASAWKDEKDLADIFVYWNGYAYGKGVAGKEAFKELQWNLKTVDITYNKVVSDEHDLFGCCCYFGTQGGMTAAAKAASGRDVKTYYGDTREPEVVRVRTLADEVRRVVRTKLLNPKWIEGQKRHGYKGASEISKRIGRVYGWEATTGQVDDWIFDDITKSFVCNEENRQFFEENNPWALEEIARRLLEAEQRGLWNTEPDLLQELKENYIEIEVCIEEKMGDVEGEFQGGSIDIFTAAEVQDWKVKMKEIKDKLKD